MRHYKSGSTWAFWRWTITDSGYLTRLHILKTPWFAICLHWINEPDPEPFLHDHPVSFLSIVLKGAYVEVRRTGDAYAVICRSLWNFVRASVDDRHSIVAVSPAGALTLCFMGPKTREWGFHRPEGWQHWKDYYAEQRRAAK